MGSRSSVKCFTLPSLPPLARLHDIEIAVRVDPDPVAGAVNRAAPAREALAVEGQDADHAAIVLGDVNDVVLVDIEANLLISRRG